MISDLVDFAKTRVREYRDSIAPGMDEAPDFSRWGDIEDLSTEETAEALGLSVPAVKSRLLRARLQLREKLTRFFKRKGDDAFAYM